MCQIRCYDVIYTSPPSNKKWETTPSTTAIGSITTQTGWQHPFSTDLPPLEGSSGTIRQIFQLDLAREQWNSQWTKLIVFDCTFIGGTSLDVSPACPYPSPSTLLLNVRGQTAATLGNDNQKKSKLSAKPARQANCRNACRTGELQPVNRVRVLQKVRNLHVAHASYSRVCDHWTT